MTSSLTEKLTRTRHGITPSQKRRRRRSAAISHFGEALRSKTVSRLECSRSNATQATSLSARRLLRWLWIVPPPVSERLHEVTPGYRGLAPRLRGASYVALREGERRLSGRVLKTGGVCRKLRQRLQQVSEAVNPLRLPYCCLYSSGFQLGIQVDSRQFAKLGIEDRYFRYF
jgi:hypothetical protein